MVEKAKRAKGPFFVEDAAQAWAWWSMRVQALGFAAMGAFLVMSSEERAAFFSLFGIGAERGVALTAAITFLSGMFARVKRQPPRPRRPAPPPASPPAPEEPL